MGSGGAILAGWCEEAVRLFGPDLPRITTYVHERLGELTEDERQRIEPDFKSMLEPR
jgi:hypothetical protein